MGIKHRIRRAIARLILFTPLGDVEAITSLHWWAIRRFPGFFRD